jgi:hypothetical protein
MSFFGQSSLFEDIVLVKLVIILQLEVCYNREGLGFLIEDQKTKVKLMEGNKWKILLDNEKEFPFRVL